MAPKKVGQKDFPLCSCWNRDPGWKKIKIRSRKTGKGERNAKLLQYGKKLFQSKTKKLAPLQFEGSTGQGFTNKLIKPQSKRTSLMT
jgi:hypothetical protein